MIDKIFRACEKILHLEFENSKPVNFVYDTDFTIREFQKRIDVNLQRAASELQTLRSLEHISRRIFSLLVHEFVGHQGKPLDIPSPKVVEVLHKCYPKDCWDKENLPWHFQFAILGCEDCDKRLRQNGYGKLLDRLICLRGMAFDQVQLDLRKRG